MKTAKSLIVVLASLASVTSCTSSPERASVTRTPEAKVETSPRPGDVAATSRESDQAGKHWVQSEQLSDLMNSISAKMLADAPEDLHRPRADVGEDDVERAITSAAKLAEGLAASAERIPVSVEHVKMSEADRAGFLAEAETLRKQALELGQAARARKTDQMQRSLAAISSTCISCHSRYRDFAGELDIQRAAGWEVKGIGPLCSKSLQ
jgi:hypothetical protein